MDETQFDRSVAEDEEAVAQHDEAPEGGEQPNDWENRHRESQRLKEDRRKHFETVADKSEQAKQYFRPAKPAPSIDDPSHKRVAAYTRVSTSSLQQVSSIENQTLYYTKKINDTPNWELQAIYSDEGKSGTSMRHRDQFKQMLRDAKAKKMDMIICASVSRFARNVTDCLDQISELKTMNPSHPIGVFFETENIYTLNPDSDQALSIHALLADWESANKSRRMFLSFDQRILTGQYPLSDLLGYRHTKEGELVVVPEEAKTVKFIFLSYLLGYSYDDIADMLTEKHRSTLRGRQEWNSRMVVGIMNNERRWGALEVRKRIVVDYKKGKTTRNNGQRCSAFVPNHHEGIVSPEIASAIGCIRRNSTRHSNGLYDLAVISSGMLKGFVAIIPSWGGVDNETLNLLCSSVYSAEELKQLQMNTKLADEESHSNVSHIGLSGYEVPYGIGYLTKSMPAITISKNKIAFNPACHRKFANSHYIQILYHPILQMIVIRESDSSRATATCWIDEDGKPVTVMPSKEFSEAVFTNMCWKKDYSFRFRGITKQRNGSKIMLFFLDEPQIILGNRQKRELEDAGYDLSQSTAYIPYREDQKGTAEDSSLTSAYGYPEEWNHSIGMTYELRSRRDAVINAITDTDIQAASTVVDNPLIGHIPSREELESEFDSLLASM